MLNYGRVEVCDRCEGKDAECWRCTGTGLAVDHSEGHGELTPEKVESLLKQGRTYRDELAKRIKKMRTPDPEAWYRRCR